MWMDLYGHVKYLQWMGAVARHWETEKLLIICMVLCPSVRLRPSCPINDFPCCCGQVSLSAAHNSEFGRDQLHLYSVQNKVSIFLTRKRSRHFNCSSQVVFTAVRSPGWSFTTNKDSPCWLTPHRWETGRKARRYKLPLLRYPRSSCPTPTKN